jgi:hypothetical protein
MIITFWFKMDKDRETGALEEMVQAVTPCVQVDICTDVEFSTQNTRDATQEDLSSG